MALLSLGATADPQALLAVFNTTSSYDIQVGGRGTAEHSIHSVLLLQGDACTGDAQKLLQSFSRGVPSHGAFDAGHSPGHIARYAWTERCPRCRKSRGHSLGLISDAGVVRTGHASRGDRVTRRTWTRDRAQSSTMWLGQCWVTHRCATEIAGLAVSWATATTSTRWTSWTACTSSTRSAMYSPPEMHYDKGTRDFGTLLPR